MRTRKRHLVEQAGMGAASMTTDDGETVCDVLNRSDIQLFLYSGRLTTD